MAACFRRSAAACSRSRRRVPSTTRAAGAGVTRVGRERRCGRRRPGRRRRRPLARSRLDGDAGERLESGRRQCLYQPTRRIRQTRCQGDRLAHPRELLGARMRVSARRKAGSFRDGLGNRLAMRLDRASHVRRSAAQRRDLRTSDCGAALGEAIVDRPRVPVHLVHSPRHKHRFLQRLDPLGVWPRERLGQLRAHSNELAQRAFVEIVDTRLDRRHTPLSRGSKIAMPCP